MDMTYAICVSIYLGLVVLFVSIIINEYVQFQHFTSFHTTKSERDRFSLYREII